MGCADAAGIDSLSPGVELSPPDTVVWRLVLDSRDWPIYRAQRIDPCAIFANDYDNLFPPCTQNGQGIAHNYDLRTTDGADGTSVPCSITVTDERCFRSSGLGGLTST